MTLTRSAIAGAVLLAAACASLQQIIQPPQFAVASNQDAQIRLLGPSLERPLGGAALRVYARVANPNPFGFTLSTLRGNVFLEGQRAAAVDLPLGLPLTAQGDTIIPLEVALSFADVPALADVVRSVFGNNTLNYRFDGIVAVDAGPFGQPSFGPSTWLDGAVRVVR